MRKLAPFIVVVLFSAYANGTPVVYPENGHQYDFISGFMSWDEANQAANTMSVSDGDYKLDGHLATISDAGENAFLADTFGKNGWIGLVRGGSGVDPASGWYWVTWYWPDNFTYSNWASGEPNNNFSIQGQEDRGQFYPDGTWNDINGNPTISRNGISGFYVEYQIIPEPTPLAVFGLGLGTLLCRRVKRGLLVGRGGPVRQTRLD